MAGIVIKPRARIFHGHEWVYGNEVRKVFGEPQPGDVISLKDYKDRPLGSAIFNPQSQIVARRFSRRSQDLNLDFFNRRIQRALDYRSTLSLDPPDYLRLVWSESDGLPGVVIDRYGDVLVIQTNTLAFDQRIELITEALTDLLHPAAIIERNDSPIRVPEGLALRAGILSGNDPGAVTVNVAGIQQTIDFLGGQKTGVYLDQWDNYSRVAALAPGRRVLDCFANQGGFALACAAAGASSVTAVDSSAAAIETARTNANALPSGAESPSASGEAASASGGIAGATDIEFIEANAFDFLKRSQADHGPSRDLVILDPPSFTRRKGSLNDALRGYKEIHLRALRLLDRDGILATFCCSHHVDTDNFLGVIRDAAVDARRQLRLVDTYRQRADHPILATVPETEYLKGFAFQLIGAW